MASNELTKLLWGKARALIRFAEGDHVVGSSFTSKSSFSQLGRLFFVEYGMSLWLRIFIHGTNPVVPRSWRPHLGTCPAPLLLGTVSLCSHR